MTGKVILIAVWVIAIAAFFVAPRSTPSQALRFLFWIMAIVHTAQFIIFLPKMLAAPGSFVGHLVKTMLFGYLHVRKVI
ncbi:MAG: hypothetical protein ACE5D4_09680 [Thermodesulfobacteriota bacterium]